MKIRLLWKLIIIAVFGVLWSCTENNISQAPQTPPPHYESCAKIFVDGYTDKVSYNPGETAVALINFKSQTTPCNLSIYDMAGALAFAITSPTIIQTVSSNDPSAEGFGYKPTVNIPIPANLKSGVYLIENSIPFIVKSLKPVDAIVLYPSNTINAYSHVGGRSMYDPPPARLTKASFQRPSEIQWQSLHCLKWFNTKSEFTIGYMCDSDMDDISTWPLSKMLIIPGHSEYWTRAARKNFDVYVERGHHAVILSGNTMWWQVRYSADRTQMYCYRDAAIDPEPDQLLKTITWDKPTLQFQIIPSIGADFNHGGYGIYTDNGWDGYKITNSQSPLLEGLSFQKGSILSLPSGEYDGVPISQFDTDGYPVPDVEATGFKKLEIIGFDKGSRGGAETIGTFIVGRRTDTSGIIINAASYDWCSYRGMGGYDGDKIKLITDNAIKKLLSGVNVFTN